MRRPEYWESDEVWASYEQWLQSQPVLPQPSALERAIDAARYPDVKASIHFLNAVLKMMRER